MTDDLKNEVATFKDGAGVEVVDYNSRPALKLWDNKVGHYRLHFMSLDQAKHLRTTLIDVLDGCFESEGYCKGADEHDPETADEKTE